MIRSFVFSEGKLVGENVDTDALKLVRGDKGLQIWVDLFQATAEETKTVLEELFGFHPLAVEDCVAINSLPKVDDYEEYLFVVVHAVDYSREDQFTTSELNLFLGKEFLVTYHTAPLRAIASTIERVQRNSVAAGARGPDRLMHTILDLITDNYDPVIIELQGEISALEEGIFKNRADQENVEEFLFVRKELNSLRQIIRPQAEVIGRLADGQFKLIRPMLLPYYRNVRDNLRRIEERAINYNEQLYLAMDVFLNKSQMETNQVIKVLTLLTGVTTPVIVIGSWYGMNFENMPELAGPHSYLIVIVVTVILTAALVTWFRLRRWI